MLGLKRKKPTTAQLREQIADLARRNRTAPDLENERELIRLRHQLGIRLLEEAPSAPQHPEPAGAAPPASDELPDVALADLTPELLRAGILRDGCVLVRGLIGRDDALALAADIERGFIERAKAVESVPHDHAYYDEFVPDPRYPEVQVRPWVLTGGGLLAADCPHACFRMLELFEGAGIPRLVEAYLGEPPMLTFEKTTLRKADPSVSGAWHQDGHFMGSVRALNLWLSLSRCGDEAPGLDVVPRRLDELVAAGEEGAFLDYQVSDATAAVAAGPKRVLRPIFEPGDALLFDDLFLHQTASDPAMPNPRYAVESWFFGGSSFPDYAPIAV